MRSTEKQKYVLSFGGPLPGVGSIRARSNIMHALGFISGCVLTGEKYNESSTKNLTKTK